MTSGQIVRVTLRAEAEFATRRVLMSLNLSSAILWYASLNFAFNFKLGIKKPLTNVLKAFDWTWRNGVADSVMLVTTISSRCFCTSSLFPSVYAKHCSCRGGCLIDVSLSSGGVSIGVDFLLPFPLHSLSNLPNDLLCFFLICSLKIVPR